ncbi:GlxA family transcriptional regulator [Maritalea sp.]|uniref:GlxA family transcriptional regulator n=1 Tax=Maritalea sp. TaxID=2003361 RepID=UPI003EF0D137
MNKHPAKNIIKVYFVLGPIPLMLDFAGPCEIFRRANIMQDQTYFDVRFVGNHREIQTSIGLPVCNINPLPSTIEDDAMVIISGSASTILGHTDLPTSTEINAENTAIVNWLKTSIRPAHKLITICSGALLAARAGLFDGYKCTTHHDSIEELKSISTNIKIEDNCLFTTDRNRYASAGITSGVDLMLEIVGEKLGIAIAAQIAKFLVVYTRRNGSDPQMSPWLKGRDHLNPTIHRIQDMVGKAPTKDWDVTQLANAANMSVRHFSRLFNAQTGLSVPDYINGLRIAIAEQSLRAEDKQIENLSDELGFASSRHFRRAWNQHHELPPRQWRNAMKTGAPLNV